MKYFLVIICLISTTLLRGQDCYDYWNSCHKKNKVDTNDVYQLVVNKYGQCVSKSAYISDVEILETYFDIFAGRDYRMSICTTFEYKPIIRLYEIGSNVLVYDNSLNDSVLVFEYQQWVDRKIKAIISIPQKKKKSVSSLIVEKPKRYCIGFKLESMITRK
jgi:hypothetical protein